MTFDLPNIRSEDIASMAADFKTQSADNPPRILVLYGSLRDHSYSRLLAEEVMRILGAFGADARTYNPSGLPLPDDADSEHPKAMELRDLTIWAEGMVWVSPERHGAMTSILKTQIDWIPLALGSIRPTQGKTLALMQVNGGSQSFNTVNQMRILGRWMRMLTIPNQSSIPKVFNEFDDNGRMKASPFYNRVVDVVEELMKFTLMTRGQAHYLVDRYSERVESPADLSKRVNQKKTDS
ncbi:arsenical resistance protein ArsH [Alphaproteobacteria bacterium]|nr:arsenical resistance protein ArsH [Alphaproteobacteria bacterium]